MFSVFFSLSLSPWLFLFPPNMAYFSNASPQLSSGELGLDQNAPCWSVTQIQLPYKYLQHCQKPYISVGSDTLHVSQLFKCCLFVEPCDRIWKRFLLTIRNWELYTSAPANRLACISRGCFMETRQFLGDACALFNITQARRWQPCFASEKLQTRSSCCEQRVSDNRRLGEGWRQAKPCCI